MSKINWHRLFGLVLTDLFSDSNYQVELEKELSIKKQYLDVVIIKKTSGQILEEYPAGLENLNIHNLLTYKSLREPLNDWAIEELIGYYSNYRKIVSPSLDQLLPAEHFQLYAVSTRYPQQLLNGLDCEKIQEGVFDLTWGIRKIRVIIINQIALQKRNAFWLLFSGQVSTFEYGDQHYHWRHIREKAVLAQLYELHRQEGLNMAYTIEDFEKDFTEEHLHLLSPEQRLKGLPAEERLKGLPAEERLKGLPAEERLKGLPLEIIEQYLSQLKRDH